jgi:hypothetical protein
VLYLLVADDPSCKDKPVAVIAALGGAASSGLLAGRAQADAPFVRTGSGLVAGSTVNVTGIAGATGCNVSTTVSPVVDTTHTELTGTTIGRLLYQ